MTSAWSSQAAYDVRCDWGAAGAAALATDGAAMVIVDVLSFTTSVTVAVARGIRVYPFAWRDERAAAFAAQQAAVLAAGRRSAGPDQPWSLSPAALQRAPVTPRLVLPSPNGSAVAAACRAQLVVAGCLRNAAATGRWLARQRCGRPDRPVAVIAAGERWPDGSLRPALEDLLGAGAIIAALHRHQPAASLSPEAAAARAAFQATPDLAVAVHTSASGRELTDGGFAEDVQIATTLDSSDTVPVLDGHAFAPAASSIKE